MKKFYTLVLILISSYTFAQSPCINGMAGPYPCNGYDLQDHLTPPQMGGSAEGQDSWGWTDTTTGKEYAIIATDDSTAFIDISDPQNIVYLGKIATHTGSSLWRDVKVYKNYCYIVSDGNGNHGMQYYNLEDLRTKDGSPTFSYTTNSTQVGRITWGNGNGVAHNIVINEDSGFAYIIGSSGFNSGGPIVLKLDTNENGIPGDPSIVALYPDLGYCHDAQVVTYDGPDPDYQGREIMIGSFSSSNFVHILDMTELVDGDPATNNVTQISSISYTDKEYTHQGWFTEDKRFFLVGDELDEPNIGSTRTFVFDLEDLDNPSLHYTKFGATGATDHNGYVRGNRFYLANYTAGMRVFKLDGLYENPPYMDEIGSFDTYQFNNNSGTIGGAWNVYPYFDSGNIVISGFTSSQNFGGLHVVRDPDFDGENPVAVAQNFIATLENSGSVTVTANQVAAASTDNVGIVKSTIDGVDTMTFTCDDVGIKTVTLEVVDDYGNKDSVETTITVNANNTSWTGSNWNDGIPGPGSLATIGENYNTNIDGNIDACLCEVAQNKTLQISADNYIKIQKNITVKSGASLLVAHTGNLVQIDEDAQVTREAGATIDIALTTPSLNARDFMLLGSPMNNDTEAAFNGANRVMRHSTEAFDPYTATPLNGVNFVDDDFNDYTHHTGLLNPGEGYFVRPSFSDAGVYHYNYTEGTPNNGTITYDAYFGDDKEDSPSILANPYASALNASKFIQDNPVVSEVYFWEHNTTPSTDIPGPSSANFSMQDVSVYNGTMGTPAATGGTTPNGVISTGQGFAIKANNPGGLVTFTNDMRLTSGNVTLRAPESRDLLWLNVKESTYNTASTTGIGFLNEATDSYDEKYDSAKLATIVSLYTHLQDGSRAFSIQGLSAFNETMEIPVGFSTLIDAENHEYIISLSAMEGGNLENVSVILKDHLLETTTNLNESDYKFNATAGTYNNRFTLLFNRILETTDVALENTIAVHPNPGKDIIIIESFNSEILNTEIFDVRGRRIVKTIATEDKKHTLDISNLETGIYYISINTKDGLVTKKVIKM